MWHDAFLISSLSQIWSIDSPSNPSIAGKLGERKYWQNKHHRSEKGHLSGKNKFDWIYLKHINKKWTLFISEITYRTFPTRTALSALPNWLQLFTCCRCPHLEKNQRPKQLQWFHWCAFGFRNCTTCQLSNLSFKDLTLRLPNLAFVWPIILLNHSLWASQEKPTLTSLITKMSLQEMFSLCITALVINILMKSKKKDLIVIALTIINKLHLIHSWI